MSAVDANRDLAERGDLDELVRHVDRLGDARDWPTLLDLRQRCEWALARGRQLWPIRSLIEYRLALFGPGEVAGPMVAEGTGHLALGPLTEVAAQDHTWAELGPHIGPGPARAFCAHERVIRGEVLDGAGLDAGVLDLPFSLQPWEPVYAVATYRSSSVELPRPDLPTLTPVELLTDAGEVVDDPDVASAVAGLAQGWKVDADGHGRVVAVEGDAHGALAAMLGPGPDREQARVGPLAPAEALAQVAWAAAGGGVTRRRGAARGRFEAWWLLAALGGWLAEWPVPGDELGSIADGLRWWAWDTAHADVGWSLRLLAEDPAEGVAWAVDAAAGPAPLR